jgi:flagellar basal body-associated protein FliL
MEAEAVVAETLTFAEEAQPPKKPGLLKRLLLPLLMLLAGAGAGAAGMYFLPQVLPVPDGEPKPPKVKVAPLSYIELPNSFTANLKDSGRYVQVKIALSTHGGDPVSESVERHKVAIVAATLGVLADTTQADLDAPGGRDRLAGRMRIAINDVLQRKTGAAGIDDVLLTSYVVQ